jgi:hypothetical protein
VIFTSQEATQTALRKAAELANRLAACSTLVVPQVVPHPLPLESPPVLLAWSERHFRRIAEESPVETKVRSYLCRDRLATLAGSARAECSAHPWVPQALVADVGKTTRAPLRRAGHEVILVETE